LQLLSQLPKKPKFIGFGSFAEYGKHTSIINELTETKPINLYGLSKLVFKEYSEMLCNQWNMDWLWIRPCYVYGPQDVQTRFIPSLIQKFLKGESVTLDACTTIIDYIYIDDFVDQVYALALESSVGIFNICSGNQYHIKDIIKYIHEMTLSTSKISYDETLNRSATSSVICGDSTKTIKHTKNKPKVTLQNGLNKTIEFYKNKNKNI
jgi:nucleoside-diphosphate-sugar epimerase